MFILISLNVSNYRPVYRVKLNLLELSLIRGNTTKSYCYLKSVNLR